jgi:hypothetical protein
LANFLEESYALAFDVLRVDDVRTVAFLNQFMQPMLAFDEWQTPQIFTVEPQQVESIEDGFATPGHQFIESTDALCIEADDFAVDNSVLYQHLPERFLQGRERLELIQVAGDQLAFTGLDVGDRAEAVVLQLEQILWIVERPRDAGKAHGLDAGKHYPSRCRAT